MPEAVSPRQLQRIQPSALRIELTVTLRLDEESVDEYEATREDWAISVSAHLPSRSSDDRR